MRLPLTATDRYLLRSILPTVGVVLLIAAVLLIADRLLGLLTLSVGTGAPGTVLVRMLLSVLPSYIRVVLPLGLFLGVLISFRELSAHSELYVLEGCGIGIWRLVRPALLLAALLALLDLGLAGYVEPLNRYVYEKLRYELVSGLARSGIDEGLFVELPNGLTAKVRESWAGGRRFRDFFGFKQINATAIETVSAPLGELVVGGARDKYFVHLVGGRVERWYILDGRVETIDYETMDVPLDIENIPAFRRRGEFGHELTFVELARLTLCGRNPERRVPACAEPRPPQNALHGELNSRLTFALSTLIMPLLAVPFGIASIRSSRMTGMVVGTAILLAFHKVLEFEVRYAAASASSGGLLLWSTWGAFFAATVALFVRTIQAVGQTPFQKLESAVSDLLTLLYHTLVERLFSRMRNAQRPVSFRRHLFGADQPAPVHRR